MKLKNIGNIEYLKNYNLFISIYSSVGLWA